MARFDYTSKCAHPVITMKILRQFANDLGVTRETWRASPDNLSIEELLEFLHNPENIIMVPVEFIVNKGRRNCAYDVDDAETLHCKIDICFSEFLKLGSKVIRNNAIERNPIVQGFSYLTFVLLHEIGHHATANDYDSEEEELISFKEAKQLRAKIKNEWEFQKQLQSYHYSKHNEIIATNWAINWLSNPENRVKAKAFEKAFFAAWRG